MAVAVHVHDGHRARAGELERDGIERRIAEPAPVPEHRCRAVQTAEHHVEHHSNTGIDNRKLLMWIFLGSECLFFAALISTYLIFNTMQKLNTRNWISIRIICMWT